MSRIFDSDCFYVYRFVWYNPQDLRSPSLPVLWRYRPSGTVNKRTQQRIKYMKPIVFISILVMQTTVVSSDQFFSSAYEDIYAITKYKNRYKYTSVSLGAPAEDADSESSGRHNRRWDLPKKTSMSRLYELVLDEKCHLTSLLELATCYDVSSIARWTHE